MPAIPKNSRPNAHGERVSRASLAPGFGIAGLITLALLAVPGRMPAEVIEQFPVAIGPPNFGEQPRVCGNLVVWSRYAGSDAESDVLQLADISRPGNPPVAQIQYPAYSGSAVLFTATHLLRAREPAGAVALRIDRLLSGVEEDLLVSEVGFAPAANRRWAFIRTNQYTAEPFRLKLLAKSVADFGDPSPETLRVVAELQSFTSIIRTEAASERYIVWQDHAPYDGSTWDTWKVYARSMDELFTPGAERLVVDTGLGGAGAYLDLAGSILVVQATDPDCPRERGRSQVCRILLVDLDRPDAEPVTVIETEDPDVYFKWPSVSSDYVVWTEMQGFFVRTAYGRRLVDGRPAGAPFAIGPGGSWIMIDRNIAVWNGSTTFGEGEVIHGAIMAAELALPGAEDVGDVDGDGSIVLTDAVVVLNYLFQGGWRPRLRLADANLSGTIDLGDAVRILEYLFLGGRGGRRPGT